MVTGYYFLNEEEEILYVPYEFELAAIGRDNPDNEADFTLERGSKPQKYIAANIFILDCDPNHLENIVLGIRTDENFRRRILEGDVEEIEIPEKYIHEFKRIYNLRQEKDEFARFFPLEGEHKLNAEELFSYIDSQLLKEEVL